MSEGRTSKSWLLRLAFTAAALGLWWWLARISPAEAVEAVLQIAPGSLAAGAAFGLAGVWIGGLRWRLLLEAFGAARAPATNELARLHLIALFYNTFLPANVMGDVLRAHLTREAFEKKASAYFIVLLERVFGLAGLLLLAGSLMLVAPIGELGALRWVAPIGLLGAAAASASPFLIHAIGAKLPARLAVLTQAAPPLVAPHRLLGVLALSVLSQGAAAMIGFFVVASFAPVAWHASLIVFPVALVATYAPTIAGIGTREAAFVVVLGAIGVSEGAATATALAYLGVQLGLALLGGLLHLLQGR